MFLISPSSTIISYSLLFSTVYASPLQNLSRASPYNIHNHVTHQDFSIAAPFPILEIGLQHILAQIGANATIAGNDSMSGTTRHRIGGPELIQTQQKDVASQCGPGVPCTDGSCCNSVSVGEHWIEIWKGVIDRVERRGLVRECEGSLLMFYRKANADIQTITAGRRRRRDVFRIVTLGLCVAAARWMARRSAR